MERDRMLWMQYRAENRAETARDCLRDVRHIMNDGVPASGILENELERLQTEVNELLERIQENEAGDGDLRYPYADQDIIKRGP